MYTENSAGERTEPCLVPFAIPKDLDLAFPHLTQALCSSYTNMSTLMTMADTFLFKRFSEEDVKPALVESFRAIKKGDDAWCSPPNKVGCHFHHKPRTLTGTEVCLIAKLKGVTSHQVAPEQKNNLVKQLQ